MPEEQAGAAPAFQGSGPPPIRPVHQAQLRLRGLAGCQPQTPLLQTLLLQALQGSGQALRTLDLTLRAEWTESSASRASVFTPTSPSARPHLLVPEQPGGCHVLVVHKCSPHGPPGVTVGHSGWAGPNDPAHRQVSAPPGPRGNPREQPGEPLGPGGDLRKPRRGGPRPSWRHSQAEVARVAPEPWLPSRPTQGCPSPRPDAAERAQA